MEEKVYNYFGEEVTGKEPEFASENNKKIDGETGEVMPAFAEPSDDVDEEGFDKHHVEGNGEYKQTVILPKGTKLCRYGAARGKTTTLQGTPFEQLALPFLKETMQYHEYEVIADGVSVVCVVTRGKTAPMFDSEGGAIQFVHRRSISEELETKRLKEVKTWLRNRKKSVAKP